MVGSDNPFEKVLDRLREKGWRREKYGAPEGPNCIAGAALQIGVLNHGYWRDHPTAQLLESIVISEYRFDCIPDFNDHPDTTFSDVERVLEKAAVKWEEERVMRDD